MNPGRVRDWSRRFLVESSKTEDRPAVHSAPALLLSVECLEAKIAEQRDSAEKLRQEVAASLTH